MQKVYQAIINTVHTITGKWNKTTRGVLLFCCCCVLMSVFFFGGLPIYGRDMTGHSMIIGTVLIIAMTVCSIDQKVQEIKWSVLIYYPMILFGVGILIISTIHPVGAGYITFAINLILVFPLLYYVWINRGDYETLYISISIATFLNAVISFIYSFILSGKGMLFIKDGRIAAFTTNPNILGMLGVTTLITSVYIVLEYIEKPIKSAVFSVGIGIGLAYSILPASRTASLAAIAVLAVSIVFLIKIIKTKKNVVGQIMIVCCLVIAISAVFLITGLKLDDRNINAINKAAEIGIEETQKSDEEMQTDATAEAREETPQPAQEVHNISDRINTGANLDMISSGRLSIWQIYVSHFSWFGVDIDTLTEELLQTPETRAHNNIIDYTCRFGYIVGFIYVIFYLACSFSGIIMLIGRKYNKPIHFLMVSCIGVYALYAMLEIATLPFYRCIPCMFFLAMLPIMGKTNGQN